LNLGNLAAGESCVITLRYAQTLSFEQHGLRLLIPTVIAPRYGDPVRDGGLQPHQAPVHSLSAEYPFDIELHLHGDLGRLRVASPSHPIAMRIKDGHVTVSLARRGALDRDFVLVIDELEHDSTLVTARDSVAPGYAVLASFCPRIPRPETAPVAVKLLVDCSGSMAGDSIQAARRALRAIAWQMKQGDRFSLSRFGSTVEHRSRALWTATDTTRVAAQRWIGALKADLGGTEMKVALESTFALASSARCDVLMVTDGEISAIDQTIEAARASGHRMFVVGIGSSPAETHLRRLAKATGGACDFVAPGEAVEPAVLRMFARLRSPRLDHVHIVWPEQDAPRWASAVQPAVFDGDTVHAYALFDQPPTGAVRLMGTRSGHDAPEVIASAEFSGVIGQEDALPRMAAHARAACAESDAQATRLSVDYQLVTDRTNYLLVHQRAEGEQATDMPELHKVAQMVPAGWGGVGAVQGNEIPAFCRSVVPSYVRRQFCLSPARFDKYDDPDDFNDPVDTPAFLRMPERFTYPLTPLTFAKKLRATLPARWPASYAELRSFGVEAAVVDWLELAVAVQDDANRSERDWVDALVFFITHNIHDKEGHALPSLKALVGPAAEEAPNVDRQLVETLATALQGITADAWPDQVYAMSAKAEALSH
jgi:Ca-activated chloride channel family protein